MTEREKVVKGLTACVTAGLEKACPTDCPYFLQCFPDVGPADPFMQLMQDALALLKEQNWISVKNRLPNCNGCYLVWRPHFYPDKGMPAICYFDGQNTWHDSYGVDFTRVLAPDDVSHWMPLPEQP